METIVPILINAISGAVGGGLVSRMLHLAAINVLPKLVAGAVGGIAGGTTIGPVVGGLIGAGTGDVAGGFDLAGLLGQIVGAGVGGGALTGIAGAALGFMKRSS